MKTTIWTSAVLALSLALGSITAMLVLDLSSPTKTFALGGPGGDTATFDFRLGDARPGTVSSYSFTVINLKAFQNGDKLTITFPAETDLTGAAVTTAANYTVGDENAIVPTAVTVSGQALTLTAGAGMDGDTGDTTPNIIEAGEKINVVINSAAGIKNNPLVDLTNVLQVVTDVTSETTGTSVNFNVGAVTHISSAISPDEPGAAAQYKVVFITHRILQANIDTITVRFDEDIGIPTSIRKENVFLVSDGVTTAVSGNQAVNPKLDPQFRLVPSGKGAVDYTITVPSMDTKEGNPIANIKKDAQVTVIFDAGAGLTNPTVATAPDTPNSKYTLQVKTSQEPEIGLPSSAQVIAVPLILSLKGETVTGKGFDGGSSAIVWLDTNQNGERDAGETDLVTVPINSSSNTFEATFSVTVPPFVPGPSNTINAIDGQGSAITVVANMPSYEVKGSVEVTPATAGVGDTIQVTISSWPTDGAIPTSAITIAGIAHSPVSSTSVTNGKASFDLTIDSQVPSGTQKLRADFFDEDADVHLTITGATLIIPTRTMVANQTLSAIGSRYSTSGATINKDGDNSLVSIGGVTTGLKAIAGNKSNKINSNAEVSVDSGGNWSASIIIPITTGTTTPGVRQIKVVDSVGGEGTADLIITERTLLLDPVESRLGTTVFVTGKGFPAKNTESGAESVPSVIIEYAVGTTFKAVATVIPDTSGNFRTSFKVPLDAALPSINTVQGKFTFNSTETITTAVHRVPRAKTSLDVTQGRAGDIVTVIGEGFKAFTTVNTLEIGDLDVLPLPKPSTGESGAFTASFIVPQLGTGIKTLSIKVGDTTASASFTILPAVVVATPVVISPASAQAPGDALAPLIANNDNLVRIWHFDPSRQNFAPNFGWFLYDPRPVFAAANSVSEIVGGKFYWVNVRENQTVILGGELRTLFGGWNPISW